MPDQAQNPGLGDAMLADNNSEGAVQDTQETSVPRDEAGRFAPRNDNEVVETTEAPAEDTQESPQIDWEARYNNLRSHADRRYNEAQQELETYQERLARLEQERQQPQYDDDYDDDEAEQYADPVARQHIARLEAQLAAQQEKATLENQRAQEHAFIDDELDRLESSHGFELSDRASSWIGREALANLDPITGQPDVEAAYVAFRAELEEQKKQWVSTKPGREAAPVAGPGAVEVPDLTDKKSRIDYINARIAQSQQ